MCINLLPDRGRREESHIAQEARTSFRDITAMLKSMMVVMEMGMEWWTSSTNKIMIATTNLQMKKQLKLTNSLKERNLWRYLYG
jgi:hypothetical protein